MTDDSGPTSPVEWRQRVRAGYDDLAEHYAADREQDPQELALVEELADRTEESPTNEESSPRILDAGCGDGRIAAGPLAERGAAVVGFDASRRQLELASETLAGADAVTGSDADDSALDAADTARPAARHPTLVQGDLTTLPFGAGTFDGVAALHSIIHVPREEHATVLAEFARVLEAGGWLLLTTGVGPWKGKNPDWLDAGAEMRWSFHGAEWTREALGDAGFVVADERTIGDELGAGEWRYLLARRH